MLRGPAREDSQGSRGRLLECVGAHRGLGERERGRPCMGEGVAAGRPVLVDLKAPDGDRGTGGLHDKALEDVRSTRCFVNFRDGVSRAESKLSVF